MKIGTTRPYPPTGITSADWRTLPLTFVRFDTLTTTQDGIYLHALFGDAEPAGGDRFPHVVLHDGVMYLEDGHTRVAREYLRGYGGACMRIYDRDA